MIPAMRLSMGHLVWINLTRPIDMLVIMTVMVLGAIVSDQVTADVIFHVPEVLVRHAAVPKSVGTGKPNATRNDSDPWAESDLLHQQYEYFVEHAISTADAKKMAMMLKLSEMPDSSPGCGTCTKRELEYCETKVLADHCCCERHFLPEPFPWLPHTCYIGPERCTTLANNCAHYARLRDCCCLKKLAERWKTILSKSPRISKSGITFLVLSAVVFSIYL